MEAITDYFAIRPKGGLDQIGINNELWRWAVSTKTGHWSPTVHLAAIDNVYLSLFKQQIIIGTVGGLFDVESRPVEGKDQMEANGCLYMPNAFQIRRVPAIDSRHVAVTATGGIDKVG